VVPADRLLVGSVATPLVNGTVASVVVPSKKVTLPAGVPATEATFAVSVTAAPAATGFGVALKVVEVAAGAGALTTRETAGAVLADRAAVPA
jgi:hypothetical protein